MAVAVAGVKTPPSTAVRKKSKYTAPVILPLERGDTPANTFRGYHRAHTRASNSLRQPQSGSWTAEEMNHIASKVSKTVIRRPCFRSGQAFANSAAASSEKAEIRG